MTKPTVLILTAGENSRFFPFNTETHKGNIEINGEPLIVRTLRNLEKHEFRDVVIVVSEKDYGGKGLSEMIQSFSFTLKINFVLQPEARGMGDAVLKAKEHLSTDSHFVVISNYQVEAGALLSEMLSKYQGSVICATETKEPWNYGIIKTHEDLLDEVVEKPHKGVEPSNLKIQSVYVLPQSFLTLIESAGDGQYTFESALTQLAKKENVFVFKTKNLLTLKYPWHIFHFQKYLFEHAHSSTHSSAKIAPTAIVDDSLGPVIIAADAVVGHAAKIMGPAYIGKGAMVGDFSFVRESSIEQYATVGANTEVVRSILFHRATIHFGYLADSIIGSEAKIGAGLITANKRHDRATVRANVKGEKVDTYCKALGVCVGSHTKIGVRTTTMPGVMIGANAVIYPTQTLYKNIAHSEVVKG